MKNQKKTKYKILELFCAFILVGCILWLILYFANKFYSEKQMEGLRDTYVQNSVNGDVQLGTDKNDSKPQISETITKPQGFAGENASAGSQDSTDSQTSAESWGFAEQQGSAEQFQTLPKPPEASLQTGRSLEEYDVPEKEIDFVRLRAERNPHIYAWITIPGTKVDYPILQHPEKTDYYLDHNLDGSKGYPGCIYTQQISSKDWTDKHTVMYGHNMKNGTMFGSLHYYEDPLFFEEHAYVYLYTEDKILVYQIFAAYEYGSVHLLLGIDTGTSEKYQEYLESIFENDGLANNFNKELELTSESRIITLSTCTDGSDDRRWLVQAVLMAEGER